MMKKIKILSKYYSLHSFSYFHDYSIFNVLGEAVDERGALSCSGMKSIHRSAPPLDEQSTSTEVLETGIKVIDLFICPFAKSAPSAARGGTHSVQGNLTCTMNDRIWRD